MSLLHNLQAMEWPTTLIQDEFKIEVCSFSENGIICHSRSTSLSSSSTCSPDATSNFSFCDAHVQPAHLHVRCAYADEIFQNGQIRPLHSQPFQAVTLCAHLAHVETINVHEILEPCASSARNSPSHTHAPHPHTSPSGTLHHHRHHTSLTHNHHHPSPTHTHGGFDVLARATPHHHASLTHGHHHHPHHTSHTHNHSKFEPARATTHPHDHASHSPSTSFESARASLHPSVAAKCRRALCLLPLRRVCHVNEDESPSSGESFTPDKRKYKKLFKARSTTHLCNMKKLHEVVSFRGARSQNDVGNKLLVCKSIPKQGRETQFKEAPPLNISPRVNQFVHTPSSPPSPHAIHYHAQRAHKESMKNRTSLPYRHGLLACIGY